MITRKELIKKYTEFFKEKGHRHIPSASVLPINDPTVLFITAGMQPLVPFLSGEQKHPLGKRLVNVQKCIRTGDIEEVGDTFHHTFFEMLGNWSLGDYFKEEAITWSFEFLTKVLKLDKERLAITVFAGDNDAPRDEEAAKRWQDLGIPSERLAFLGKKDNWWGPAGNTGPCGPDTEMFYWKPTNKPAPKKFDPEDTNWVEIWNDVLMGYTKNSAGRIIEAKQKNIDTGMGVERTLAVLNNLEDNYRAEMWWPIIQEIEKTSKKSYEGNERPMRIIADHIKAATIMIGDGATPGNADQGYIVRRLIRRAIRYAKQIGIEKNFTMHVGKVIITLYPEYPELKENHKQIEEELEKEEVRFRETLEKGLKKFEELAIDKIISGKEAFLLFQSYGFPIEMTKELADERGISVDEEEYNKEFLNHQDLSRTAAQGKFKSGLADNSEQTKKLHTATHLLNEALRVVLKDENIKQRGSNITPERLRFDFSFDRKLTPEEKTAIEEFMNEKIRAGLNVVRTEEPLEQAMKAGAQAEFGAKYPELVSVYTILDPKDPKGWFSKEICTGPHVENTKEIGSFKIKKEESSSAGVRRIKAVIE